MSRLLFATMSPFSTHETREVRNGRSFSGHGPELQKKVWFMPSGAQFMLLGKQEHDARPFTRRIRTTSGGSATR